MAQKASHEGIKGVHLCNLSNLKSPKKKKRTVPVCVQEASCGKQNHVSKSGSGYRFPRAAPEILSVLETICSFSKGTAVKDVVSMLHAPRETKVVKKNKNTTNVAIF